MKRPAAKAHLLRGVLILVNVCGLALLVDWVWQGTQTARLLATEPKSFPVPELDIGIPAQAVGLGSIQDQPLFYANRRFYTPPPPSAVPVTPPRPEYKLAGTFIIPSKPTVALLTGSAGVSRKVKTGDDLDGWTVQAVEAGRVTLQFQSTTFDIVGAGKGGNSGMQVVPLTQTAQSVPSGAVRVLGAAAQGAAISRQNYSIPSASPRLYRPPPK
jgi:hypothetical protein